MNFENMALSLGHFFLMFLRVSAIFTISPVFGRRNVPSVAKAGLSLLLTAILITVYPPQENPDRSLLEFFVACIKQITVGLVVGITTTCFFAAAATAGHVIDIQVGFSVASTFDPQFGTQVSLSGNILNYALLVCFFLADGHHMLIKILGESFRLIPVDNVNIRPETAMAFAEIFIKTFIISIQMAMPVIAASLISELCMGILMRLVPQINFFVIGFPVKIALGLFILFAMIPAFVRSSSGLFDNMFNAVGSMFEGMVA
ncbi:MAG TPA: flagellar type III secretion system protein FliR [Firmicutes bacterium]|jgi:flagellar biosynthetic protein FliR|nr:flagellar type III secretion system protein FliR [Bacillota bacterium]